MTKIKRRITCEEKQYKMKNKQSNKKETQKCQLKDEENLLVD